MIEFYSAINLAIFNNMDEPRAIMLSEISHKETDKYCIFSLNNKINELTQQNRNGDIDTENKYIMARGKRGREEEKKKEREGDKDTQTSSCKISESQYEIYSMGNTDNNYIISLNRDKYELDLSW